MEKTSQIEKFISKSVKEKNDVVDDMALHNLFDHMTTEDIQMSWILYSSSKALSTTNAYIPDWKLKEHEKYFQQLLSSYRFYPKEKDANNKYIIDRNELINHIKFHISKIIKEQVQSEVYLKNKPFLEKVPFYIIFSTFIIVPFFIVGSIFNSSHIGQITVVICYSIYTVNFISYLIVQLIIRHKYKKRKNNKN